MRCPRRPNLIGHGLLSRAEGVDVSKGRRRRGCPKKFSAANISRSWREENEGLSQATLPKPTKGVLQIDLEHAGHEFIESGYRPVILIEGTASKQEAVLGVRTQVHRGH
jgi:hypothetical protein